MCPLCRLVVMAFWLFVRAVSLVAQASADPSGHWEGAVQLREMPLVIEVDVVRNANGVLAATFTQPSDGVKGFPFAKVAFEGRTLRLELKAGSEPSTFTGVLSEDGATITGNAQQAGVSASFRLTRTGQARVATLQKSGRISKDLEGTWNGTLDVDGKPLRLALTLTNHADGTASGTIVSPDGSGIAIPVGIKETASDVSIEVPVVSAVFAGTFNSAKSQLAGKWMQGPRSIPLTLRRGAPQWD